MEATYVYAMNYLVALIWVLSVAYSLLKLRRLEIQPTAQAVWRAVILFFPIAGVLAFLLVNGKRRI